MVPGALHHPSPASQTSAPLPSSPQQQGEGGRMAVVGEEEQVDSFRGKDQLSVSIPKQQQIEDESNANCAILVDTVQATTPSRHSAHENHVSDSCEVLNNDDEQKSEIINATSQIAVHQEESCSPKPANSQSPEHQTFRPSINFNEETSDVTSNEDLHIVNQKTTTETSEESHISLTKCEIEAISLQLILEQIIEKVVIEKVVIESFESAPGCKDTGHASQKFDDKKSSSRIFDNEGDLVKKVSEKSDRTTEIIPDQLVIETQDDSCDPPAAALSDSVTIDAAGSVANQTPLQITKIQELNGGEKESGGNGWLCTICTTSVVNVDAYHIHLHQFHANPNLLTIEQVYAFMNHFYTYFLLILFFSCKSYILGE